MEIPIITTESYLDEFDEQQQGSSVSGVEVAVTMKRKRPHSKYEFRGSQSHRCSLVAVCEADTGKTTVKWSSVRVGKEAKRTSTCPKTNSANGGLSLASPSLGDNVGKEVRQPFTHTLPFNKALSYVVLNTVCKLDIKLQYQLTSG